MTDTKPEARDRGQSVPTGWEGIVDPGEHILWQGRPDQRFHIELIKLPLVLFGLAFAGFASVWMGLAAQAGGGFWMFGLIHFSVGLGIVFGTVGWGTLKRRGTWYTLTDRRAFIATHLPLRGKRLDSYTITSDTRLSLRAGSPGSVMFAREERRGSKGGVYTVDIGFERIDDAERTLEILRGIQRGADAERDA